MKLKVVVHEAEEGGYWVEVPALPGCVTQGETFEELISNLYEAVEGWLAAGGEQVSESSVKGRVMELVV
jgi:predicted RNase H-like HicB family nuclease